MTSRKTNVHGTAVMVNEGLCMHGASPLHICEHGGASTADPPAQRLERPMHIPRDARMRENMQELRSNDLQQTRHRICLVRLSPSSVCDGPIRTSRYTASSHNIDRSERAVPISRGLTRPASKSVPVLPVWWTGAPALDAFGRCSWRARLRSEQSPSWPLECDHQ